MKEIWKSITGFEGYYEVSNLGRVRSLDRINHKGRKLTGFVKKLSNSKRGYLRTALSLEGVRKTYKVHLLVAKAFLGHTPVCRTIVVDHIDNDKHNNKLSNLQIISQRENCSKDRKRGTSKYPAVTWSKASNKWRARLMLKGKRVHLGLFTKELEAHKAVQKAIEEYRIV